VSKGNCYEIDGTDKAGKKVEIYFDPATDTPMESKSFTMKLASALVVTRVVWGFVGSRYARFSSFFPTPARLVRHVSGLLSGHTEFEWGHNPLGALMMMALMGLVFALGVTGWMQGLDAYWGEEWLQDLHENIGNALMVLVGLQRALWTQGFVRPCCGQPVGRGPAPARGTLRRMPRIDLSEVEFTAIRAQGAGGQNVNKVSNAVHLRFAVRASSLPEAIQARLLALSDQRITTEGVIVIKAQTSRSLEQNKADALQRLQALVDSVATLPKARKATKPTFGSKQRRLEGKATRAQVKQLRGRVAGD
jgi:ribosome-associated protein